MYKARELMSCAALKLSSAEAQPSNYRKAAGFQARDTQDAGD
jgi:hypothetical protein